MWLVELVLRVLCTLLYEAVFERAHHIVVDDIFGVDKLIMKIILSIRVQDSYPIQVWPGGTPYM